MLDRFAWGRKLTQASRLFFFKHDVLHSADLAGNQRSIMRLYQLFAPIYDFFFPHFGSYQATANHIVTTLVQPGEHILDLGAGTGFLTLKMAPKAATLVAMDLNPDMLVRARRKAAKNGLLERIGFNQGCATRLPFRDGSFSLVTSSFMEVYLPLPDKLTMLHEIHRVLAPGGRLIFMTGNGEVSRRYIKQQQWEGILAAASFGDLEFTELYDVFRVIFARKVVRPALLPAA
jgi:ubiquinone/menaquinone biosynthesis C-methylase UbiE